MSLIYMVVVKWHRQLNLPQTYIPNVTVTNDTYNDNFNRIHVIVWHYRLNCLVSLTVIKSRALYEFMSRCPIKIDVTYECGSCKTHIRTQLCICKMIGCTQKSSIDCMSSKDCHQVNTLLSNVPTRLKRYRPC